MLKRLLLIGVLLGTITGCSFSSDTNDYMEVKDVRTELAFGLLSYSKFSEVKSTLNLDHTKFNVLDESHQTKDDLNRPPFDIYTIRINDLEINGFSGNLELSFFNDRLMYSRFYTKDIEGYIAALKLERTKLESRDGVLIKPYTCVWVYTNHQNISYIGWKDIRLSEQFNEWIKRYS